MARCGRYGSRVFYVSLRSMLRSAKGMALGHTADVEGARAKLKFTGEQATAYRAHLAEERGEKFDPATAPKDPLIIWRIEGRGAVISD